jgi:hypothetical protein
MVLVAIASALRTKRLKAPLTSLAIIVALERFKSQQRKSQCHQACGRVQRLERKRGSMLTCRSRLSSSGGTGRRAGLKIRWPQGRVGSIPSSSTIFKHHCESFG